MSLPVINTSSFVPSAQTAGWGTSLLVHVVGAVVFSVLGGSTLVSSVRLQGDNSVIELQSWQEHRPQAGVSLAATEPLKVEVMPHEVHIARRRYHNASATSTPPTVGELAAVERLTASLPSPQIERSSQVVDSQLAAADARQAVYATVSSRRQTAAVPQVKGALPASEVRLLESRPPVYPSHAEIEGWEGLVLLQVHVTSGGTVQRIEVLSSSGHSILDAAAVRAVRSWRFAPSRCDGVPIPSIERIPVRFSLK